MTTAPDVTPLPPGTVPPDAELFLYHLTLQSPTAITHAVAGNFSGGKQQEILVSRGRELELFKLVDRASLVSIAKRDVFGIIRSLQPFRMLNSGKDYIAIGSDSGKISIVEFDKKIAQFKSIHQETFGKSGVRRIVPGQYLAADPKGRALMIGAVEKQKFVYVMNRDSNNKLTISSPLSAHKSRHICFALCAIDVQFENPVFASLEQQYASLENRNEGSSEMLLTFWEMDLGLNHVVKKVALPVDSSAHMLIPVPGGTDANGGPSGVIVCCENFLLYKAPDHEDVACALPRRLELAPDARLLCTTFAVHRVRNLFFFLVQSELGDVYKVELQYTREGDVTTVTEMTIRLLDSLPVATAICVLRTGFLFLAAEAGDHQLYRFVGVAESEVDAVCCSTQGVNCVVTFRPSHLRNLLLVTSLPNLAPVTDMTVVDASGTGLSQLYLSCGRGTRSSLRALLQGSAVEELADNSLPGHPLAVWTLKDSPSDTTHKYIFVGLAESTLLLSVGSTVAEVSTSPFLQTVPTLLVAAFPDGAALQVYETGARYRSADQQTMKDWKAPASRRVTCACSNGPQVVLSLTGGELVQLESEAGQALVEVCRKQVGYEVACCTLQPVTDGRARGNFVAVSGLDNTVRFYSTDYFSDMRQLTTFATPGGVHCESVCLCSFSFSDGRQVLYLFAGLETGVLVRMTVDPVTTELSDQRQRFLGPRGVRLFRTETSSGKLLVTAVGLRPWILSAVGTRLEYKPLHCPRLVSLAAFSSSQCTDGFVALSEDSHLKVLHVPPVFETFNQTVIPLTYTPRKLTVLQPPSATSDILLASSLGPPQNAVHPNHSVLAVLEAENRSYDEGTRLEIAKALLSVDTNEEEPPEEDEDEMTIGDDDEEEDQAAAEAKLGADISPELLGPPESQVGTFQAAADKWASCIRIVNPSANETIVKMPLAPDEAALCCTSVSFWEFNSPCLVVGTVTRLDQSSGSKRVWASAALRTYAYNSDYRMTLLHTTPIAGMPVAMCAWEGRLVVSFGTSLRVYSLGRKRLLRKCEFRQVPEWICWVRAFQDTVVCGDIRNGFVVVRYRSSDNTLHLVCEEEIPHWVVSGELLDSRTVVSGDKFDTLAVCRIPRNLKENVGASSQTQVVLRESSTVFLQRTPTFETIARFHIAECPTALQRGSLNSGASEGVIYCTVLGAVGALLPLASRDDVHFLQLLQAAMRRALPPLCGREQDVYRSYYAPMRHVFDGDFCEGFFLLSPVERESVAREIGKSAAEIQTKLEELRTKAV